MIELYNYENSRFYTKLKTDVVFDINIRPPIVQIYSESGSGKTFFADYITSLGEVFDEEINMCSFNKSVTVDDIKDRNRSLIVIDRGDLILTNSVINHIIFDKNNHYIIFARTCIPLSLTPNYYGDFVCSDNNVISIKYGWSEPCWFVKG